MARQVERRQLTRRWLGLAGASVVGTACVLLLVGSLGLDGLDLRSRWGGGGYQGHPESVAYRCVNALEDRDRFLLGSASPEVQAAVRSHLKYCTPCRRAYLQRAQELEVEHTVLVLPAAPLSTFASR